MGAVAGPNIIVLMLTAMEHDLQSRINTKMDTQMLFSMQSIFFGNAKAQLYGQLQSLNPQDANGNTNSAYAQIQAKIQQLEQKEKMLQAMEKTLDMEMKQLETQLKITQQRKEAAEKMLDKNIQSAFSYGQR
ncbi:MAG: hypothetical protein K6A44_01095 [bacterium]|nr:hypothetical protein [bacterium]